MSDLKYALFRYRTDNIGDDTQSYAIALNLPRIDALVDRDALADLALPSPHDVVTNSWFFLGGDTRPPSASIRPIFHGISVGREEMTQGAWLDYFKQHGPVGCRDIGSVEALTRSGVDAFWSGCLTLFIGRHFERVADEEREEVLIIDVPEEVERAVVPPEISARAIRLTNAVDPLLTYRTGQRFAEVHRLMRRLAHAKLVISRRLHIALPCVGFGTPVLAVPNPGISDARFRFSGFDSFVPTAWLGVRSAAFDFTNPAPVIIPADIEAAFGKLQARLQHVPVKRTWSNAIVEREWICPTGHVPTAGLDLVLGMDREACMTLRQDNDRMVVALPRYPFAEKITGDLQPREPKPTSIAGLIEHYEFRRVVELIGDALARRASIRELDPIIRDLARDELFEGVMLLWLPVLQKTRHGRLEAEWRRRAIQFGVDSYECGRLVEALWRAGDNQGARLATQEAREALDTEPFRRHDHPFFRDKNRQTIENFEAVFDYEAGQAGVSDPRFSDVVPFVTGSLYDSIWNAGTALERERLRKLALLYLELYPRLGHGPNTELWSIRYFLIAHGFYRDAIAALERVKASTPLFQLQWLAMMSRALFELSETKNLEARLAEAEHLLASSGLQAMLDDGATHDAWIELLDIMSAHAIHRGDMVSMMAKLDHETMRLKVHSHHATARRLLARLEMAKGRLAEGMQDMAGARARYLTAAATPLGGITEDILRAIDHLTASRHWGESAQLYEDGVSGLWQELDRFVAVPFAARLKQDDLLFNEGMILSGAGVGDDIFRLALLVGLKGRERDFQYDIDPRLVQLARDGLPGMRFESVPYATGNTSETRRLFWTAREGVPRNLDGFRITNDRLERIQRGEKVMLSEDIVLAYLRRAGNLAHRSDKPLFRPGEAALAGMRERLEVVRRGRRIACVAWRSGLLTRQRSEYFFRLPELAPLFADRETLWIPSQYGMTDEERHWLKSHVPNAVELEELDFWNDFQGQAALFATADVVVAPKLSTRDFAAACGARTLSMTIGHCHVERIRIADDEVSDRVFPSIRHVSSTTWGAQDDVVAETARLVSQI